MAEGIRFIYLLAPATVGAQMVRAGLPVALSSIFEMMIISSFHNVSNKDKKIISQGGRSVVETNSLYKD